MRPLLALLLLAPLAGLDAADLVLVAKDTPPAPIIVFKDAPPRTREAAVTLAEYIEKVSGQKPAILEGEMQPLPERAIWIGVQPVVKALFPKTDFDFKYAEETLIVANEKHLVIAGRDRWDPAHMEAKGRLATKTGIQQEYGTANAVYSFIQEQLGVRWLWPDEEDVIKRERLAIAPMERRYHPQIRARGGMIVRTSLGDNKEDGPELWARFQRVQLDSMDMDGGHGFSGWWEKFDQLRDEAGFLPWAKVVVRFKCLSVIDRLRRDRRVFSDGVLELLAEEAEVFDAEERERSMQALRSCLEGFSPPHQELLLAPYSGEGRVMMLAEQAGKSANALYKLLGRLREKLAACIETRLQKEAL